MCLAPRAEVPWASNINSIRCQTILKVGTDAKGLFVRVSNHPIGFWPITIATPAIRVVTITRSEKKKAPQRVGSAAGRDFSTTSRALIPRTSPARTIRAVPALSNPIHAEIVGSDTVIVGDMVVVCAAPIITICRELVARGADPAIAMLAFRSNQLAVKVRAIGEAAQLEINGKGSGFKHRATVGRASPIAPSEPPATPQPTYQLGDDGSETDTDAGQQAHLPGRPKRFDPLG